MELHWEDIQQAMIWLYQRASSVGGIARSNIFKGKKVPPGLRLSAMERQPISIFEISGRLQVLLWWSGVKSNWNPIWCSKWAYPNLKSLQRQSLPNVSFMFLRVQLETGWFLLRKTGWQLAEIQTTPSVFKKTRRWAISMPRSCTILAETLVQTQLQVFIWLMLGQLIALGWDLALKASKATYIL